MKLDSIFLSTSKSIFEVYLKYQNNRVRNMKLASVFLSTSESIFEVYLKYQNKRVRNTKFEYFSKRALVLRNILKNK